VGFYAIERIRHYFLRVCTFAVVPFLAATTFLTIGITIGANFIAVLTIFDTFTNTTAPFNEFLTNYTYSLHNIPNDNS